MLAAGLRQQVLSNLRGRAVCACTAFPLQQKRVVSRIKPQNGVQLGAVSMASLQRLDSKHWANRIGRMPGLLPPTSPRLQESPAWPVLVESCAARDIKLGLLNARMSSRAFLSWFQPRMSRALLRRMLTNFSLIVPQSDIVSDGCLQLSHPTATTRLIICRGGAATAYAC
jgi:hypothetical protein